MSAPKKVKFSRARCSYKQNNERFLLDCDFPSQYHKYYRTRYLRSKERLIENCKVKWEDKKDYRILRSLAQLADIGTRDCIVLGIISKRMNLKLEVIKQLTSGFVDIQSEKYLGNYCSKTDKLVLEDAEESILLTGNINPANYVTGIAVALLGRPIKEGSEFLVVDTCFLYPVFSPVSRVSPPSSQGSDSGSKDTSSQDDKPVFLLIVSDLGFNKTMIKKHPHVRALQRLIDFVWAGVRYENDIRSSRTTRILMIGCLAPRDIKTASNKKSLNTFIEDNCGLFDPAAEMKRIKQLGDHNDTYLAIKHMDNFVAEMCKTIDVEIIPGPNDPGAQLFPQQPFHPWMLPKSKDFKSCSLTTNPHNAFINNDIEILVTSSQDVDITSRFCEIKDPIEIMKCHLQWGYSAPSAPDNLYSVPNEDQDPFCIDFLPDIYIAGMQDEYRTDSYVSELSSIKKLKLESRSFSYPGARLFASPSTSRKSKCDSNDKKQTILLTVPRFSQSFKGVLVDIKKLSFELIDFGE